jgi:amino acid adenylation domain-containing protein
VSYVKRLQARDAAKAQAFWRKLFNDSAEPAPLGLISAEVGSQFRSGEIAWHQIELSQGIGEAMRRLAEGGISRNALVCGAWAILLNRYSGKEDVMFGATVPCRPSGLDSTGLIVGPTAHTLPVRIEARPESPLLPWLKELNVLQRDLHEYGCFSLDNIRPWVDTRIDPSSSETSVVLDDVFPAVSLPSSVAGLEISGIYINDHQASAVSIGIADAPALSVRAAYDCGRINLPDVERLVNHFKTILEAIATGPAQPVGKLQMLTGRELHQLLVEWNGVARVYAEDKCIHELFEERAGKIPGSPALVHEEREVSYGELNRRANQVAHYLRERGVGPEVKVGLCAWRGVDMIVGMLGILKAGGAYVPLDPEYPVQRLAYMMEDSRIAVLLTQDEISDALPSHWSQTVCLDSEWGDIARHSGENLVNITTPDNLAYVIYTSGSTGQPKGVAIEHRGICNLVEEQIDFFGITPDSRVLQFASISFDASVSEVFTTLVPGAELHIAEKDKIAGGKLLLDELKRRRISVVTLPPAIIATLPDDEIEHLKTIVAAGEPCPEYLVKKWGVGRRFINAYGPTEVTVAAAMNVCDLDGNDPPIGKATANKKIYVLNKGMQPVPVGVKGEIYIGGSGLARCYVNKPDLTADRFIPNPFASSPGERLYRSGDLASFLPDGKLIFAGRVDEQVKVRGYRIELGEIEAALMQDDEVEQAAVVVRQEELTDKRLVAFVVARPGHVEAGKLEAGKAYGRQLRKSLADKLPDYMVPSEVVLLDRLPLTPSGKLDRRSLASMSLSRPQPAPASDTPRTVEQELLAGIWADVLGLDSVGLDDSFFDLGGHSLLATQVISRAREVFQVEVSLRSLFEHTTVRQLGSLIAEQMKQKGGLSQPPLMRADRGQQVEQSYELSYAQQRLWFIDQMEPSTSLYNIAGGVKLEGLLEVKALERSLNEIERRHEVLRTSIQTRGGKGVQVIREWEYRSLQQVDLSELDEEAGERESRRIRQEEASEGFELSEGRLMRVKLIRRREREHELIYTMHHIITDDWSMNILIREMAELYELYSKGEEGGLEELEVQYADYARWQREWLKGEVLEQEMSYWREQLGGELAPLELPVKRGRRQKPGLRGWQEVIEVKNELTDGLNKMSRQENVTLFMTLLSAYAVLLSPYARQEEVRVLTLNAGRTRAETQGLIGFFLNNLVLRVDLRGNPTFRELLARVRAMVLGAYAHQELPFNKLVEEIHPERTVSRTPLAEVVLNFQPFQKLTFDLQGLSISPFNIPAQLVPFELAMNITDTGNGLLAALQYNTDLFYASTIKGMLAGFEILLSAIQDRPDLRLDRLKEIVEESNAKMQAEERENTERARLQKFAAIKRGPGVGANKTL